ncbi:acyl-coenzyme A thioesterase 8 [Petaurus breviceps papuanus]|uniref:acyl-coenzyme A thioesterase 8 n=1 Tax=Petaurus breviceps papuanus TaxID=3040969 RepID=UPI0036DD248A
MGSSVGRVKVLLRSPAQEPTWERVLLGPGAVVPVLSPSCGAELGRMSPPLDSGSSEEPSRDLRSVLVTSVLNLEPLDEDLYRGRHYWVPVTQRLFGGQIVGQALVAAAKSVSEDVHVHSLHCYFVRTGDPKVPVLYQVERTRTGASFSVRSVKAVQHGKPIFIFQASFQQTQPSPIQHQFSMPSIPQPEELPTHEELIEKYLRDPELRKKCKIGLNRIAAKEVPIEIKPVDLPRLGQQKAKQMFWVRARGHIGEGDMKMHCCVAAYISDYAFLGTAILPHHHLHQVGFMVSLDHSMWFHAPFRADHWMLYECESPWAGGSRGLVHGRLWRQDGVLAVTCAQEGVIRVKQPKPESKL